MSPAGHTTLQPASGVSTATAKRETPRPRQRGWTPCGMHGSEEAAPGVLPSLALGASGTRLRGSGWARTGEISRSQRTWGPWGSSEEEDAHDRGEGVPRQPEFREGDVG